jgi:hypothetical protein
MTTLFWTLGIALMLAMLGVSLWMWKYMFALIP